MDNWGNGGLNFNTSQQNFGQNLFRSNSFLPRMEAIRVNGEAGARAIQMAPNSSQVLIDNTNSNLIWVAQTDGAGYLTVTPFDVFPHKTQQQLTENAFEERLNKLEEKYEQLASGFTKQSKKQQRKAEASNTASQGNNEST